MDRNFLLALALTAGAGLATTLGSLLGLVVRKPGPRLLSVTSDFSSASARSGLSTAEEGTENSTAGRKPLDNRSVLCYHN